jgi:FtsZ-interacting cell division protein YlmF
MERDAITDRKLEHSGMGPCLVQEPQTFDDAVVQVDQFCFGEAVYIDLRCHDSLSFMERTQRASLGNR